MKYFFALFLMLLSFSVQAQTIDLTQSSPNVKWKTISNDFVQVIYPDYLGESVYIANLVEHYSQFVGKTYGIDKPEKFTLIIRPELGDPNGFVTFAPRRSEWFASSVFFPFVGATEWYQTLSIHEYRHVNQFDHFNQNTARGFYYFMGDFGRELAAGLSLPTWYLEGDAVWAETKYTDGGRGRSPRFLARLKALVLSDKLPTYDQFLNGTYTNETPNYYVYGYALISYGTKKYGDDFWARLTEGVAGFPHPFRFYSIFKDLTGQRFQDFYQETMDDLKKRWAKDAPTVQAHEDFRDNIAPAKLGDSTYYVNQTLDTHSTVIKETRGQKEKVAELSFYKEFSSIQFSENNAIYTEFLPDSRYGYRDFSDLILLNLKTGEKTKLTQGLRIYNPSFNQAGNKIIATEFKADQSWAISEFDLQGHTLQSFTLPNGKVAQAVYLDDNSAAVLFNSKTGLKSIITVDLKTHQISKVLIPSSRNLLNALYADKNKNILFEAQYKGSTDIFKIDNGQVARCTNSKLGATTPSSDGENVSYSDMDTDGSVVKTMKLSSCAPFQASELVDFKYLGDTPSDHLNDFPVQAFPDQEELFTKNSDKYHPEDYGDFDRRLLIPHTWGLALGRGGGLGITNDNYLRTLSLEAFAGITPEEQKSIFDIGFSVKKYYPIFDFKIEQLGREVTDLGTSRKLSWTEKNAGVNMLVPYIKRSGVHNFEVAMNLGAAYSETSRYEVDDIGIDQGNHFYKTSAGIAFSWSTDMTARSIMAPWLVSYSVRRDDAKQPSNSTFSGNRTLQKAVLQTPSIFSQDGFKFTFDQQDQKNTHYAYKFMPDGNIFGYTFSRGYNYQDVAGYKKYSANYVFPIANPDWNIPNWIYVKRVSANLFYDSTKVSYSQDSNLDSYGAELLFETKLFRILPVTIGGRLEQRLLDDEVRGELFLATAL